MKNDIVKPPNSSSSQPPTQTTQLPSMAKPYNSDTANNQVVKNEVTTALPTNAETNNMPAVAANQQNYQKPSQVVTKAPEQQTPITKSSPSSNDLQSADNSPNGADLPATPETTTPKKPHNPAILPITLAIMFFILLSGLAIYAQLSQK